MISHDVTLFKMALWGLIFVPFLIGLYWMWNKNRIVDGANDNLSGCYMGIAVLKALHDQGITLENTEVGVILSGSEEAGLRGAKAWCEAHKGEFDDVPTIILSYDTIHDPKYLMTNYRDLNGTVKADKAVSDLFMESAADLNIPCKRVGFHLSEVLPTLPLLLRQASVQQVLRALTISLRIIIIQDVILMII